MKDKSKGITLIALIITIIVMLILVSVSINIAIKSELFENAGKASRDTEAAKGEEQELAGGKVTIGGKEYNSIEEYTKLAQGGSVSKAIPKEEAANTKLNSPNVKEVIQTRMLDKTYEAPIPVGFTVSGRQDEQSIDGGLVIYEIPEAVDKKEEGFWINNKMVEEKSYPEVQCEYNQFVWVPVETAYVTVGDLQKIISESDGAITTEQQALQNLVDSGIYPMAVQLSNGTDYRGILYNFTSEENGVKITAREFSTTANYNDGSVTFYREPAKLNNVDQTKEAELDLQTEYNNIVKSIANQKGFWVARYELSYRAKAESKRGARLADIGSSNTWYDLYTICQDMYPAIENVTNHIKSNMIYGSQWDQIMIWIKDKRRIEDATKYYVTSGKDMEGLQVTGAESSYECKKIFDLGENYFEWTVTSSYNNCRNLRGANYQNFNWYGPASGHSVQSPFNLKDMFSTRVILCSDN